MPGEADPPPGTSVRPPARVTGGEDGSQRAAAADAGDARAPRVLFPAGATPPSVTTARAAGSGGKSPTVVFGAPAPRPPKNVGPRVLVGGTIRQRIPCETDDLLRVDAAASPAVVADALRIVRGVNLDDAFFDDVMRFGADLQAEHARMTDAALRLASDPALRQGQGVLAELVDLFALLDPARVFPRGRQSFATALSTFLDPPRRPEAQFDVVYPQILDRAQELAALDSRLRVLAQEFDTLDRRHAELSERVAAYVLAAEFLIRYVRALPAGDDRVVAHYRSQIDALESRVLSLLATRTTAETGRLTNRALQQNVQTLRDAGSGMVTEDLPAFQTAYTAALGAAVAPQTVHEVHARLMRHLTGGTS